MHTIKIAYFWCLAVYALILACRLQENCIYILLEVSYLLLCYGRFIQKTYLVEYRAVCKSMKIAMSQKKIESKDKVNRKYYLSFGIKNKTLHGFPVILLISLFFLIQQEISLPCSIGSLSKNAFSLLCTHIRFFFFMVSP